MAVESTARKQPAENPPLFRSAPHNIEVEQALLGAILVNNEAFYRVSDFLEPEHFFEPLHQKIYKDIGSLVRAGKTVDEAVAARPLASLNARWGKGSFKGSHFTRLVYSGLAKHREKESS